MLKNLFKKRLKKLYADRANLSDWLGSITLVDLKPNEQLYVIAVEKNEDSNNVKRIAMNFNAAELLGRITLTQFDIVDQMKGKIKPDIMDRKFVK
jgi:hypothetical protein